MNPGKKLNGLLNIGFNNYLIIDNIIGLVDPHTRPAKNMIKSISEEKPRSIVNACKGRKALTLIIMTGDRYFLSAIARQQLAERISYSESDELNKINKKIKRAYKIGQMNNSKLETLDVDDVLQATNTGDEEDSTEEPTY